MDEQRALTTTGPNTPEGKAISSQNARRYGLRAEPLVIPGIETEEDWRDFEQAVVTGLRPANEVESALAARVAELLWRLTRIRRAEGDAIAERQFRDDKANFYLRERKERQGSTSDPASPPVYVPPPRVLASEADLYQIIRYEAHLGRQLRTTLHELEALQARRTGKPAPLARLDVSLSDEE